MEGDFEDRPEVDPVQPDATNSTGVKRAMRKKKKAEQEAVEFWASVFASPVGRREMWKILADCHTFEQMFACGPNGFPHESATWFHAGEQAFGQRLYQTWLMRDTQAIALMLFENDPRFKKASQ